MTSDSPIIGIAIWLLKGPIPDRVRWAIDNGFTGVSLLQNIMEVDQGECEEAAAIIRDAGLNVTYHGNFQHKMLPGYRIDRDFITLMTENILWWSANTGGVKSTCFDSVGASETEGSPSYMWHQSAEAIALISELLKDTQIRMGIENYTGPDKFASVADMTRFIRECSPLSPGLLLDLGHANIHVRADALDGETTIGQFIEAIPMDILEVHVSDNKGASDEHKPVGYGNLDISDAIAALRRRNYTSQITVEVCGPPPTFAGAHLDNPAELKPILDTRDAIADSWAMAAAD